jgi:ribosomal protein S18 acetylase RimI-like enzyme
VLRPPPAVNHARDVHIRQDPVAMDGADDLIRTVEIAAARAWPASETTGMDGWLLRRTPAVDRSRNNSALPPPGRPAAAEDLDARIDRIEAWYRAHGGRPQIQVSPLEWHRALDAALVARGWVAEYGADVLVSTVEATLEAGAPTQERAPAMTLMDVASDEWLRAWASCEGRDPASCAAHAAAIFPALAPRAAYALARDGAGVPTAVGLVVRDPGIAGIFCMATDPQQRRRGVAGHVLRALAADAGRHGATTLYLQVDSRNATAAGLYERHGFTRSHGYHFRVAP